MSVVGIDFGNLNLLIGQTSKGGVDVILNDASNRQTATAVSIQGKQRFIGDSGAAMAKSNIKNTIAGMKLLVGRQFDDEDVQKELKKAFFKSEKLPNGGVGISVSYNDDPMVISAEHFMAMMLTKAKDISAGANGGINLADAVLAVPFWFTESQRKGVLHACQIASLNCLKIANESTLIALSYGIFKSAKKLFSETEPVHMMFIDIGYTGYCVTIVDFIQENMKVLATVCDRELGGRDFDDVIIEFLAETFQMKTGINVRGNPKAILKLQAAAEKAKKTLSPNGVSEAPISVECLAEDMDLNVVLTKPEFESRAGPLVAKLQGPVDKCLALADIRKEQIFECEILGGSSRINIVKKTLGEILGLDPAAMNYGLKTTMNADEAVARGGALQCAMVSSRMKVKPFAIIDRIPYGISASFKNEDDPSKTSTVPLWSMGGELPNKAKKISFKKQTEDFVITLVYDDSMVACLPPGESRLLARYTIKMVSAPVAEGSSVTVMFTLDKNGFVSCMGAELKWEVKDEGKEGEDSKEGEGKEDSKEGAESKDGEAKASEAPKKKFKKTELQVVADIPGLSQQTIKESLEVEAKMAFDDRLITETADKRNELESYIYGMRDKLDGSLKVYATAQESSELKKKMDKAEDWLYNEGFDSTKQEYVRQLDDLKVIGNDVELRYNETANRPQAIEQLKKQMEMCKAFASKYDEASAHITEEERESLRKELSKTESWMYDIIGKQGDLPKTSAPVLTCDLIQKHRQTLFNFSNPIMTKPKPKPAPAPEKPQAESKAPSSDEKGSAPSEKDLPTPPQASDEGNGQSEPMDQQEKK